MIRDWIAREVASCRRTVVLPEQRLDNAEQHSRDGHGRDRDFFRDEERASRKLLQGRMVVMVRCFVFAVVGIFVMK